MSLHPSHWNQLCCLTSLLFVVACACRWREEKKQEEEERHAIYNSEIDGMLFILQVNEVDDNEFSAVGVHEIKLLWIIYLNLTLSFFMLCKMGMWLPSKS